MFRYVISADYKAEQIKVHILFEFCESVFIIISICFFSILSRIDENPFILKPGLNMSYGFKSKVFVYQIFCWAK